MLGSSRESLTALQNQIAAKRGESGFADAGSELLNITKLLAGDKSLRVAIADAGQPVEARVGLVNDILGSKISSIALEFVVAATRSRWSSPDDLVEGIESLAAFIVFAAADAAGELDRVENEIFAFGHAVDANAELQMALTNPAFSSELKAGVVRDVLGGRVAKGSALLLEHAGANLRGRRVDVALKNLSDIAAGLRNRIVAEVRVAISLTSEQVSRLQNVLARIAGQQVSLNVVIDPSVVGGVSVRLGDDVIDGSVSTRLEQARRTLVG